MRRGAEVEPTMKTIAVLSRKGGAGKTTVSLSLAFAARQEGLRVVVADIDPLHSAGEVLRDHPEAASLLIETQAEKLTALQNACLGAKCDLLVIDTPTAPEAKVAMAVRAADLCLAVARPTLFDVAAIKQTLNLLRRHHARALVVLNQCPPPRAGEEAELVRQAMEGLAGAGTPLAETRLRSRLAYQQAFAAKQSVAEWDPSGEAAADVAGLLAEVRAELDSPDLLRERLAKLRELVALAGSKPTPIQRVQGLFRRAG
jgi:chromosome partitioning protein